MLKVAKVGLATSEPERRGGVELRNRQTGESVTRNPSQRAEVQRIVSTANNKPESMTMSFAWAESTGAV